MNIAQSWMLLISIILGILFLMAGFANLTKDTIDGHFDRFTPLYLILFFVLVLPAIFLVLNAYSPVLAGGVFFVIVMGVLFYGFSAGPRYYRLGRVTYGSGNTSIFSKYWRRRQLRMRRRDALRKAKSFISPYKSIFGKLILSNKYCKVIFTNEKEFYKFFCMSKEFNSKNELPFFEARSMEKNIWIEEFFNSLCFNFSYNTKLENLRNIFKADQFLLNDTNYDVSAPKYSQIMQTNSPQGKENNPIGEVLEMININSATEAELTALPGINIIMAKKIIKQRDYKGDFKSVNDFISFIKIKPHFEQKLRKMVTVKPIEHNIAEKGERILDIDD